MKWEEIRKKEAIIKPKWKNEDDTSNFQIKNYDEKEILNPFYETNETNDHKDV